MDLEEFRKKTLRQSLGISEEQFPRIMTFVDFANVNHWFDDDILDPNGSPLRQDERNSINLEMLKRFLDSFSVDVRFYYGHDQANRSSQGFHRATKEIFGKRRVITKQIQKIRHDLTPADSVSNTRLVHKCVDGDYVLIPKCNFDVEISVDAIRLQEKYDTFCLLSSDADFAPLIRHLKSLSNDRKAILIKSGYIDHSLEQVVDLKISAIDVKKHIVIIKQKPGCTPGSADSSPVSTGR